MKALYITLLLITTNTTLASGRSHNLCDLVEGTGVNEGILHISGFVTERRSPSVQFHEALVTGMRDETFAVSAQHEELENIVSQMVLEGVKPRVRTGGTTYVTYSMHFDCSAAGFLPDRKCRTVCAPAPRGSYFPSGHPICYTRCD